MRIYNKNGDEISTSEAHAERLVKTGAWFYEDPNDKPRKRKTKAPERSAESPPED